MRIYYQAIIGAELTTVSYAEMALGSIIGGGLLLIIAIVSNGGMGGGDIINI